MAKYPASRLDRRITIERFTWTKNEFNEDVEDWLPFVSARAQKRDASDLTRVETMGAEQVSAFQLSRFVVRFSSKMKTVNPADRLLHADRHWNIKSVKETTEGRNRFIEIMAATQNNGATA